MNRLAVPGPMADHDAPSAEERDDPESPRYRQAMDEIHARRRPGVLSPAFHLSVLGPIGLLLAVAAVAMAVRGQPDRAAVLGAMAAFCLVLAVRAWRHRAAAAAPTRR